MFTVKSQNMDQISFLSHRDCFAYWVKVSGIDVAVNYRAIHLLTYFRKHFGFKRGDFASAERVGGSTITLPFYVKLQLDDIQTVPSSLRDVVLNENCGEK